MAQMAIDKIPSGPKLDALTAEKVFGWRNVHQHDIAKRAPYGKGKNYLSEIGFSIVANK
jgi:hypothetical protein